MGIGNFKKTPLKVPNEPSMVPSEKKLSPGGTVAKAVEEALNSDVTETGAVADKALTYEDILKEVGLTREKAYAILDAVLIEDYYEEVVDLTPRVSATFRTRSYRDTVRYHQNLEKFQPRYMMERDEITLRYNLAASLVAFRGQEFAHPHPTKDRDAADKAFEVRLDYIESLPEGTVNRLCNELHKFDKRVYAALNEGSVEFF